MLWSVLNWELQNESQVNVADFTEWHMVFVIFSEIFYVGTVLPVNYVDCRSYRSYRPIVNGCNC